MALIFSGFYLNPSLLIIYPKNLTFSLNGKHLSGLKDFGVGSDRSSADYVSKTAITRTGGWRGEVEKDFFEIPPPPPAYHYYHHGGSHHLVYNRCIVGSQT